MKSVNQLNQVGFLVAQDRLVSPLKQMTHGLVCPVEILRVGKLQSLHRFRKRDRSDLDQKMNVIRHQDIGMEKELMEFLIIRQSLLILLIIGNESKDGLPLIASNNHMVKST